MERARNWGGGEGEDVHRLPKLLELFFVLYAESLLFVDDEQPQILERHVLLEQSMGTNEDVNLSSGNPAQDVELLNGRAEATEHLDRYRIGALAFRERLGMLMRQDGC